MKYTLSVPLFFLFACGEVIDTNSDDTKEGDILSDEDNDGFLSNEDCNDQDPLVYEGAEEICDEVDNDCDSEIDEDVLSSFFLDADQDGYGDTSSIVEACEVTAGLSVMDGDCDDIDSSINPGAAEYCDGVDNNCNGSIDENTALDASIAFFKFFEFTNILASFRLIIRLKPLK